MATTKLQLTVVDLAAQTALTDFWLVGVISDPIGPGPTALRNAIKGISDGAYTKSEVIPFDAVPVGEAVVGAYTAPEDKLWLIFKGAVSGLVYKYSIPCPDEAIFLADKETPDPANAEVIALIAGFEANVKGTSGEAITYYRGFRRRTKRHKGAIH